MKRFIALALALCTVGGLGSAHAVSDGHYRPSEQHCTADADNYTNPEAELGCYTIIYTIADNSGHTYLGAGVPQTPRHTTANSLDFWVDDGLGVKYTWTVTQNGISGPTQTRGTPADPTTGLRAYFGMDDNIDNGEHDSSPQWSNGPSDGGAIEINLDPAAVPAWLDTIASLEASDILTHPLPTNNGYGACADGFCMSLDTAQAIAFEGGADFSRDVANYAGKQWDPASCSGDRDTPDRCGGQPLSYWNSIEGIVHVEPGFQIYEDPDAQASPAGPYPIPALYVGTCGAIIGGGAAPVPGANNGAGQIVIPTAC